MIFYLGTCEVHWLGMVDVPLFLNRRRLAKRKALPKATCDWALDSGGYMELKDRGAWTVTDRQYVGEAREWAERVGRLRWAAVRDWMCEPWILEKTGLTVREHQERTVASYMELTRLAPELPWAPVLQGWEWDEYLSHVEQYAAAGVDLAALPLVGLGSVCRRQDTRMAEELIRHLSLAGLRLHGFGFKTLGLARTAKNLASSDSTAWSLAARKADGPLPGCPHLKCANCLRWALAWRVKVLEAVRRGENRTEQPALW